MICGVCAKKKKSTGRPRVRGDNVRRIIESFQWVHVNRPRETITGSTIKKKNCILKRRLTIKLQFRLRLSQALKSADKIETTIILQSAMQDVNFAVFRLVFSDQANLALVEVVGC